MLVSTTKGIIGIIPTKFEGLLVGHFLPRVCKLSSSSKLQEDAVLWAGHDRHVLLTYWVSRASIEEEQDGLPDQGDVCRDVATIVINVLDRGGVLLAGIGHHPEDANLCAERERSQRQSP